MTDGRGLIVRYIYGYLTVKVETKIGWNVIYSKQIDSKFFSYLPNDRMKEIINEMGIKYERQD